MDQEEIWNKIARPWKEFRGKPYEEVIDFLKDKKGNILDLACGSGRHFIKNNNQILYACDFSQSMLKLAKKYAKQIKIDVNLKRCIADSPPYEDNFFDAAIYIAALHCIDSERGRKDSLKELFRILKPNAQALISVWNHNQPRFAGKEKSVFIPWKYQGKSYDRYYYLYDLEEFKKELKQAGFKVKKIWEKDNIFAIVEKFDN